MSRAKIVKVYRRKRGEAREPSLHSRMKRQFEIENLSLVVYTRRRRRSNNLEGYLVPNPKKRRGRTRKRKMLIFSIRTPCPVNPDCGKVNKRKKHHTRHRNFGSDVDFDFHLMFVTHKFMGLNIHPPTPTEVINKRKYKYKMKIIRPVVEIDASTYRQLERIERQKKSLLLCNGEKTGAKEEEDHEWIHERKLFSGRVDLFINRMHHILGNRKFKQWKGSVLDSIVGVFLTQNVSDHLSSNAYMRLAAKFPVRTNQVLALTETAEMQIRVEEAEARVVVASKKRKGESIKGKKAKKNKKAEKAARAEELDWQELRRKCSSPNPVGIMRDSVDWEGVRCARPKRIADAIKERGQQGILAERIQQFLNLVVKKLDGSYDMEWLRSCPQEAAKELLGGIYGLGLKSVECVRLLALQHVAFPVDVNVARIAVRLGWVPLKPLPGDVQFHAVEDYPLLDKVQMYLWPRLCKLDHKTLYQLHYHLITFGKTICTKRKPSCSMCPLKGQCKRYASLAASGRYALPATSNVNTSNNPEAHTANNMIIEFGSTNVEPIIEFPESPQHVDVGDIEDYNPAAVDDSLISLNHEPDYDDLPMPKLKDAYTLKTVHRVIELQDDHPVLKQHNFARREPNDETPYLFAPWTPGETESSAEAPSGRCVLNKQKGSLCNDPTCHQCNKIRDKRERRLRGTIMIPCRTAVNGAFPLNGTYFQVNEVFADDSTSKRPIYISYDSIRGCKQTLVYVGSITSAIFKVDIYVLCSLATTDLSEEEISNCFAEGYICLRGFNRTKRTPQALVDRFHVTPAAKAFYRKKQRAKAKTEYDFSESYQKMLRLMSSKPSIS